MKENTIPRYMWYLGDDGLWTSNDTLITCLFQDKVMFVLKVMLIYDKSSIGRPMQPPLSSHLFRHHVWFSRTRKSYLNKIIIICCSKKSILLLFLRFHNCSQIILITKLEMTLSEESL